MMKPSPNKEFTSLQNPMVKDVANLRTRRQREATGLTLVEGRAEIALAMGGGVVLERVFYCEQLLDSERGPVLVEEIRRRGVPVVRVTDGTYRSFVPQSFADRGPYTRELPEGTNLFGHCGHFSCDIVVPSAAIEHFLRSGILAIDDPRVDGHFEVLEDNFL